MEKEPQENSDPALPAAAESYSHLSDRPQAFLSALLTEHFVLESARGITVSESSTRASLYLMTLSSSLVAFGFLARTAASLPFLAVVIPVICILGIFTYERLVQTSLEDVAALDAMQRIRRYYRHLLPGAEAYFAMPRGPHALNELLDIGTRGGRRGVFFTISTSIGIINSMVSGAGLAILLAQMIDSNAAIGIGIVAAVVSVFLHLRFQINRYTVLTEMLLRSHVSKASSDLPRTDV